MNNRLIIFVGGIWLPDQEDEMILKSKGFLQSAANVLQTNLITGLDNNCEAPVTLINAKFVGSFPKYYREALIKGGIFNHSNVSAHRDFEIGFVNLPLIKHYSRAHNAKKVLKKLFQSENKQIYVIGYSMTYSVVKTLTYAKQINEKVKTCLIIPDLPEYMNLGKNRGALFNRLKEHSNKEVYDAIQKIDSFVVLTEAMYSRLNTNAPYIVMEGIAPEDNEIISSHKENCTKEKTIVYTGSLAIKYGVGDLVDAFTRISDKNIKLIICGSGDGEDYIRKQSKIDNRIVFLGTVSNNEARRLQKEAYLLVNPRNSKEDYTKYSFPSKTLEYMMTGNPVLMYKLKGVPSCYDDFLYYVDGSLKEALEYVLSLPREVVEDRGRKGKEFIAQNKNKTCQTARILDLMNCL